MALKSYQVDDIRSKMFWSPFKVMKIHGRLNGYVETHLLNMYSDFSLMNIDTSNQARALEAISIAYEIMSNDISREVIIDKAVVNMFACYVMEANEPYSLYIENQESDLKSKLKDSLDYYVNSGIFDEHEMNNLVSGVWSNFVKVCLGGKQQVVSDQLGCILIFDNKFTFKNDNSKPATSIW
ncbi:hypothetical protein DBT73_RS03225 [Vibrio parahaemolyticus]|nr:hypothetical protein [Vibrio parahaemolyticus]EGR3040279.1 hypothetical protein [Vibrio parahaemolyticus]EJC6934473.1 hypothetical protein [Vibrio parahaemolyticus]EJC7124502.1 hypothetical protein [Vibrio parahaemolyticus]EJG0221614.1 hypothetical protein [Vibrio parahaemolyticus]